VAAVTVSPGNDTLEAGQAVQLTATPRDSNGAALGGRQVSWESGDTLVATVSGTGLVTGRATGVTTITATSEGKAGSADIYVWVGVSGKWSGIILNTAPGCVLTDSLLETAAGDVSGTGATSSGTCSAGTFAIAGTNNTGGVTDSVVLNFTGSYTFTFAGRFNGVDSLVGVVNGSGCTDCPTTQSRTGLPLAQAQVVSGSTAPERRDRTLAGFLIDPTR